MRPAAATRSVNAPPLCVMRMIRQAMPMITSGRSGTGATSAAVTTLNSEKSADAIHHASGR